MHLMTYKTDSDGRTIKWCESCGFNQNSVPEKIKSQEITNKSQHITLEKDWWHYDLYLKKMLKQHTNVRFCRFWIFTLSMPISHLYTLPPPLKTSENFRGVWNGTLAWKGSSYSIQLFSLFNQSNGLTKKAVSFLSVLIIFWSMLPLGFVLAEF